MPELKTLKLKDKSLINKFLSLDKHGLSCYAFQNIYIWQGLFEISWTKINGNLCVFFKDKIGCFMYLSPLGKKIKSQTIQKAFEAMDKFNKNKDVSRIENIEGKDVVLYRKLGYRVQAKYGDYLYGRAGLTRLKGNKFKSQRSSFNYFIKNYKFEYLPFSLKYQKQCLKLYERWAKKRKADHPDYLYQGMIEDSKTCLKILLANYHALNFTGRLVKIGGQIKAFTFGFKLNSNTFCISHEITDLSIKGLSQFIFRSFCEELKGFKHINTMDDSGLTNLKRAKLAYHPVKLVPNYIATRK